MATHVQDAAVSAASVRHQVSKILQSPGFSGAEVMRKLLSFLAEQSLERPGAMVKEYELAVNVLGRAEGFDPRLDSAVRVHTSRLRAKLAEYYMAEGVDDPILIEAPKGSHQITWRLRGVESPAPVEIRTAAPVARQRFAPKWFVAGFAAAVLLAGVSYGAWRAACAPQIPAAVEAFWAPFFHSARPPIVVFSNHRFAGSSATGLRNFQDGVDSPADLNDTYSGTGTVMAVSELSGLFSLSGRLPRLKRAELLTWDEAQDADLVFVGAPEANSRLRELAPLQHFTFKSSREEPRFGTGGLVNMHPGPGEQPMYFAGRPYTSDYAVIALLPNLHPEHKVLILAGTNTYGCQAAAEFVTRPEMVNDLYARLGVPKGGRLPDFEALIQVDVNGGVPLRPKLLAVRIHRSGR